jgi:hypothetical protein
VTATNAKAEMPAHPIIARLNAAGILKAAIIDDAYDPLRRDNFKDEISDFWNAIERDTASLEELKTVVPEAADKDDITDDALGSLWEKRDALPKLGKPLREQLFVKRLEDLEQLEALAKNLKDAGVEPVRLGSEDDLPEPFKLVFLDWLLGSGPGTSASTISEERARRIYVEHDDVKDKPFIVLMSSRPTEAVAAKDHFRGASSLIGGLFGFVAKDELKDQKHLFMHLTVWAIDLPARHDIQYFVEALQVGLEKAEEEFVRRIRALRFEDYANIQALSLHADGHPLGDYMLWLFKALLTHLLHDQPRVRDQQKRLDAMSYKTYVPVEEHPSTELAEIYQCALTEPAVPQLGPHPRASAGSTDPYLQLGDLFFKDSGDEVVMVASAACDLAYSPGEARAFRHDQPILLIQGLLQCFEEVDNSGEVRMELIKHDNRPYRILWNPSHVTSCEYGKVTMWLAERKYKRKTRLTLPYALEVQQAFAARMTRVGMPVRPPICSRRADVEVYFKGEDGSCKQAGVKIIDGAVVTLFRSSDGKDKDHFVITPGCAKQIAGSLSGAIAACEKEKAVCLAAVEKAGADQNARKKAEGQLTGAENKLEKLRRLSDPSLDWLAAARRPTAVPPAGSDTIAKVDESLLCVYHAREFKGEYKLNVPIALNLIVKDHLVPMHHEVVAPTRELSKVTIEDVSAVAGAPIAAASMVEGGLQAGGPVDAEKIVAESERGGSQ